MWGHPGKKLLFMGGEFAQEREWNHDRELDWPSLDDPAHAGVQRLVRDLNRLYAAEPALHRRDCDASGFMWTVGDDRSNSVFAFLRLAPDQPSILVVCNMTPVPRHGYRIGVPHAGGWREMLNSDSGYYGGSNVGNAGRVETVRHRGARPGAVASSWYCRRSPQFSCDTINRRCLRFHQNLIAAHAYPLGATWDGFGINFAVFSDHAERIELCLFDPAGRREIARLDLPECTDGIWHGYLPDARAGLIYGYRAHGPYRPQDGHRFNPHKLLLDPYARRHVGSVALVRRVVRISHQFSPRRSLLSTGATARKACRRRWSATTPSTGATTVLPTSRGRTRSFMKRICAA